MKPAVLFVLALWLSVPGPAAAQTLGQGAEDPIPWVQFSAALALCLLLAVAAALALRRRLGPASKGLQLAPRLPFSWKGWLLVKDAAPGRLVQLETRRLPGQLTATLLRCDDRDFLVTSSAQGQLVVTPLIDPPEVSK